MADAVENKVPSGGGIFLEVRNICFRQGRMVPQHAFRWKRNYARFYCSKNVPVDSCARKPEETGAPAVES